MTDTRKYIDEQFDKFFEFDTGDKLTVTIVSCKLFAEDCIKQLLAVIAEKDRLMTVCIESNLYLADGDDCTLKEINQAIAIKPEDVELVEYAEIWNHGDGKAGIEYKNDLRKCEMINGTKLYTIKQKECDTPSLSPARPPSSQHAARRD